MLSSPSLWRQPFGICTTVCILLLSGQDRWIGCEEWDEPVGLSKVDWTILT